MPRTRHGAVLDRVRRVPRHQGAHLDEKFDEATGQRNADARVTLRVADEGLLLQWAPLLNMVAHSKTRVFQHFCSVQASLNGTALHTCTNAHVHACTHTHNFVLGGHYFWKRETSECLS